MRENVVQLRAGAAPAMTVEQYKAERQKLRETYGDTRQEAGDRWEQELAKLFDRSGWTQEQLAKQEGMKQPQAYRLLIFGRFLSFLKNNTRVGINLDSITERRFRSYWNMTSKGEIAARFREVVRMMAEMEEAGELSDPTEPRERKSSKSSGLGEAIMKQFADGKWHPIEDIIKASGETTLKVKSTLERMEQTGSFNSITKSKPVGKSHHYRIVRQGKKIDVDELSTKLGPIIKELMAEGRKDVDTVSVTAVKVLAHRLKKLLDEWTK